MPVFHVVHVTETRGAGSDTVANGYAVFRSDNGRTGSFEGGLYRTEAEAAIEAQRLCKEAGGEPHA
jgi:hypothetical protein